MSIWILIYKVASEMMQVLATSNQVGRSSVSTASDMPYKEMASHCEALQMGKQQKMSDVINSQQIQGSAVSYSCHDFDQAKHVPSYSQVVPGFCMVPPYFLSINAMKRSVSTSLFLQ